MSRIVFHYVVWIYTTWVKLTVHAKDDVPKVTIDQGILIGRTAETTNGFEYIEFLQIPYAKPPVGDLRFKSPQPPESWVGERIVTSVDKNKICYQFYQPKEVIIGSEDCLYLNVYSPGLPKGNSEPLAVMVYIHGGGFVTGNGNIKEENGPDYLIEHDVIVVSINYRLGAYGFLSLDIPEAAGNMGLKDQVMALKWIQTNIDKFGGDKDKVTIFGVSAGSASVEYHMLSPQSKGLFHKAILQSGSTLNQWAINYNIKDLSNKLAQKLSYQGSSDDDTGIYKHLMGQPSEVLGKVALNLSDMFNGTYFGFVPSIERNFRNGEQFLTEYPYILLKEGRFHKVPVIKGFCDSEGFLFLGLKPKEFDQFLEKKNFMDYWRYPLSPNDTDDYGKRLTKLYYKPTSDQDTNERLAVEFFGDYDFTSGILTSSKLMVKHGVPVYVYMFTYNGNFSFLKKWFNINKKGASHGDDSIYVLNVSTLYEIKSSDTDILVRNRLSTMWSEFAKTGNPTPWKKELLPLQWPRYSENDMNYLVIDKDLQIRSAYEPERMATFAELYNKYQK